MNEVKARCHKDYTLPQGEDDLTNNDIAINSVYYLILQQCDIIRVRIRVGVYLGSNVGLTGPAMDHQSPVVNVVDDANQLLDAGKDAAVARVDGGHAATSPGFKGLR